MLLPVPAQRCRHFWVPPNLMHPEPALEAICESPCKPGLLCTVLSRSETLTITKFALHTFSSPAEGNDGNDSNKPA